MKNDSNNLQQSTLFNLLLFAGLRDAAEASSVEVVVATLGETTSLASILEACAQQHPKLAAWLPHIKIAVNCEYSKDMQQQVKPADEIALLPPVSGGARENC